MNRKTIAILAAVAVLVAAVAIAVLLSVGRRPDRSFKLADGTTYTIYKVVVGTNTEVVYGTDWRDRLSKIIPTRYATKLGFKLASLGTTPSYSNALVIWLKRPGVAPAPSTSLPVSALSSLMLRVSVVDDNGLESSGNFRVWNANLVSCILPNYPRRSKSIHLKFERQSNVSGSNAPPPLGELIVSNPQPDTTPCLVPEPLPARRETNGVVVFLNKLETGLTSSEASQLNNPNLRLAPGIAAARNTSAAWLDVLEDGQPTTNWDVVQIAAETAFGASASSLGAPPFTPLHKANAARSFQAVLWPEEPAWNLTVSVIRTSDFPAEELWVLRGVKVPATNESIALNATTNCQGTTITLSNLSRGSTGPTSRVGFVPALQPVVPGQLVISASSTLYPGDNRLILVRIADDLGDSVEYNRTPNSASWQNKTRQGGPGTMQYTVRFPELDNATSLDLTFAVTRTRSVTFRARAEVGNKP